MPPRIGSCDNRVHESNVINRSESYKTSLFDDRSSNLSLDKASGTDTKMDDASTTIISDTSTIRGEDNIHPIHSDNYNALESEIDSLKQQLANKEKDLIAKEKELTDLQLKQWYTDHLNDQLKTTIGDLRKENAQLKAMVVRFNNQVNNGSRLN